MSAREIKKTQLLSKSKSRVWRMISNRGLTLIELLVTMSIATIILVAVGDLGTMTLRTSMLAKAQLTTNDLKIIVGSVLGDEDVCKANLRPKGGTPEKGFLTGTDKEKGLGSISELKRDVSASGAAVVKTGAVFKGDLDIIQMRLQGDATKNPKHLTQPVVRDFVVYYKMRGVGPLGAKGSDCKIGSTNAKIESDCYSVKCEIKEYRLNTQPTTSHADYNKVEQCKFTGDCVALVLNKGGGGSVDCYTADGANPKGKTLVGCGTTKTIKGDETTSFGFNAGNGTGVKNVFMGVNAGKAVTTGEQNVVMGYQAGEHLTTGVANVYIGQGAGYKNNGGANVAIGQGAGGNAKPDSFSGTYNFNSRNNVFIGAYAGWHNDGPNNVFIGSSAGQKNTTGYRNVFIGHSAGYFWDATTPKGNETGSDNIFIGFKAGAKSNASNNVFIGNNAGFENIAGSKNVFIGYEAGKANTAGTNTFIGFGAGKAVTTGTGNVFLGAATGAGSTTGDSNTFLGKSAGYSNTAGDRNVFIGKDAGRANEIGNDNIFIGAKAAKDDLKGGVSKTASNQLNIGNLIFGKLPTSAPGATPSFFSGRYTPTGGLSERVVINGDLLVKGDVYKKCGTGTTCDSTVAIPSSKVFKKNIVPFTDYNKALQDIIRTPLFNYQYKKDHPDKTRMGVIAEDLPEDLQLKDNPVSPDWPTIWGTLWAGIKEVYARLQKFKAEVLKALKGIRASLTQTQDRLEILEKKIKALENENKKLKEHNQLLQKQIRINQQAIGA